MGLYFLLPLAIGVTVVIQGTLNRHIGLLWGLASAVLINAAVFLALSLCFYAIAKYTPHLVPEFLQVRSSAQSFSWRYLVPGVCGFFLVLGIPWSIQNIGAGRTFVLLITAQILVGFIWDTFNSGTMPSLLKIAGAVLAIAGSALIMLAP